MSRVYYDLKSYFILNGSTVGSGERRSAWNQFTVRQWSDLKGWTGVPLTTVTTVVGPNLIMGVPAAGFGVSAYLITDAYFGTRTIGSYTYTWERGRGWP